MAAPFLRTLKAFLKVAYQFSPTSALEKLKYFEKISKQAFIIHTSVFEYHQLLLFTLTHAENRAILIKAESELLRLSVFIKKHANNAMFADSGLPYTSMLTRFTQDAFNELIKNKDVDIKLESLNNTAFNLNTFLNITMPCILKEYTTAGMSNDTLLNTLGVKPQQAFEYLLNEINQVEAPPLVKDLLWQMLESFFYVKGKNKKYSKSYNRILLQKYFYHDELLKKFDHLKVLEQRIPNPVPLSDAEKEKIAFIIRNSMPLAMREIDTITYMNVNTLQVFHLERGLTLVLYTTIPIRQLPMRSFVGYSLFKNAYPISYGGSWIFGACSLFGLNILEEFRGGESTYLMTQILRVYIQLYKISYYEIEPFQFGNHEALHTGAFWFYYKFGFRSQSESVNKLASKEFEKIQINKTYKTNIATLKKLSEYNIVLQLGTHKPLHRDDILEKINSLIVNKYKGNSWKAIIDAKNYFNKIIPIDQKFNTVQEQIFEEIALWAYAYQIKDKTILSLMYELIFTKSVDTIAYNAQILKIIDLI